MNQTKKISTLEDYKENKTLDEFVQLVNDLLYLEDNPGIYYIDAHYKKYLELTSKSKTLFDVPG